MINEQSKCEKMEDDDFEAVRQSAPDKIEPEAAAAPNDILLRESQSCSKMSGTDFSNAALTSKGSSIANILIKPSD